MPIVALKRVRLLLRLGRLREDALREVEAAAERREHREHLGRGLLEALVQLPARAGSVWEAIGGGHRGLLWSGRNLQAAVEHVHEGRRSRARARTPGPRRCARRRAPRRARRRARAPRRAPPRRRARGRARDGAPPRDTQSSVDLARGALAEGGGARVDARRAEAGDARRVRSTTSRRRVGIGAARASSSSRDLRSRAPGAARRRDRARVMRDERAPERGDRVEVVARGAAQPARAAGRRHESALARRLLASSPARARAARRLTASPTACRAARALGLDRSAASRGALPRLAPASGSPPRPQLTAARASTVARDRRAGRPRPLRTALRGSSLGSPDCVARSVPSLPSACRRVAAADSQPVSTARVTQRARARRDRRARRREPRQP